MLIMEILGRKRGKIQEQLYLHCDNYLTREDYLNQRNPCNAFKKKKEQ